MLIGLRDHNGNSPLHSACLYAQSQCIEILLAELTGTEIIFFHLPMNYSINNKFFFCFVKVSKEKKCFVRIQYVFLLLFCVSQQHRLS